MSLRLKFVLLIIAPLFGIFAVILALGLQAFEENARMTIARELTQSAELQATRIEVLLREAAQIASTTADYLSVDSDIDEATALSILRSNVAADPLVFGAAIAFEPGDFPDRRLFGPYAYRQGKGLSEIVTTELDYDYTLPEWDWWHLPREASTGIWTEPYFDEGGGNIYMTTFSAPFFRDGRFIGVATIDIPLGPLKQLISSLQGDQGERYLLLSARQSILYSDNADHIGQPVTEVFQQLGRPDIATALQQAAASRDTHMLQLPGWDSSNTQWINPAMIESGNWMLLSIQDEQRALAFLESQKRRAITMLGTVFITAILAVWLLLAWVTRPLRNLSLAVEEVGQGNLDIKIKRQSGDEIGDLAASFATMVQQLSSREAALRELNENLEIRVDERTLELKQSEEALRAREAEVIAIMDATLAGLVTVDDEGIIKSFNPAAERLFGFTEKQAIGRNIDLLIPGVDQSDCKQQLTRESSTGKRLEQLAQHADGTTFPIDLDISKADTPSGHLFVWGINDISERKQAERDIHNARKTAEEANRAKSEFLANMSHELRTPMNAILGYSEMLIEEAEDLQQTDFIPDLKKINQAGTHLLTLINDILDLSKIEAGRMDLFAEDIDIGALIDEVTATTRPLMDKNNNRMELVRDNYLGAAYQDLTKLRQSLFNLLSNAAKFTHEGTVTLKAARMKKDGHDWLTLAVSDTGIGISADKLEAVFEEFTQADGSTTRDYGGTGLGLAISRRICQMLGGDISAQSTPGEGSTFTIEIPVIAPGCETRATIAEPVPASSERKSPPAGKSAPGSTVLVIDDDPEAREILECFLVKDGFNVVTAHSGDEGLRLAHEIEPAIITLDVLMPEMDGWSVLRALKADPNLRDIPVIMLTMVDDKTRGYALGATDYLSKPVDRDLLHRTLARYHAPDSPSPVLLVEDDTDTREVMRRMLDKAGWQVLAAGNGREALDQLAKTRPGLILLDLMMPVMDGFDFLLEMRANQDWRDIPVIVLTAKNLTESDRQLLSGKVEQVIEKGATSHEQLIELLHEKLGSHPRHDS
jgi:PAS domain S-box-containing protein